MILEPIFSLILILTLSYFLKKITKKLKFNPLIIDLVIGILLGSACLNIVKTNIILDYINNIAIILLMFLSGLEADFKQISKVLKSGIVVAIIGVLMPIIGFGIIYYYLNFSLLVSLFVGILFATTSVGITVKILKDKGKLSTESGSIILAAAVFDDIIGILLLSFFQIFVGNTSSFSLNSLFLILIPKMIFFVVMYLIYKYLLDYFLKIFKYLKEQKYSFWKYIYLLFLALCFGYLSELVGLSTLVGAFLIGLFFSIKFDFEEEILKMDTFGNKFLYPIFFASLTLIAPLPNFQKVYKLIIITFILAIITKIISGYISNLFLKRKIKKPLLVGIGMVSRGEIAMIVLNIGLSLKLISLNFYSQLIIVIVIITFLTPLILELYFAKSKLK